MFLVTNADGFLDTLTAEDLPLLEHASGAALVLRDGVRNVGRTPPTDGLNSIARWLQSRGHDAYSTSHFPADIPGVRDDGGARSMIAVAVLRDAGEYVLWFAPAVPENEHAPAPWDARALETAQKVRVAILEKARRHALIARDRVLHERGQIDEFFAAVGHELRNTLQAISGWGDLLKSGSLDAVQQQRALDVIEKNVRVQRNVVDDLVEASRLARQKVVLELRELDATSLADDVLAAALPLMRSKQIDVNRVVDQGIGAIRGDSERLRQVFANIFANAVKFTPPGGTIGLRVRRLPAHIEFSITDSGVGIATEVLPHVFEAFRQASTAQERGRAGGLGLGLTIAKHLVELHGGKVLAESAGLGLGATFRILLPPSSLTEDTSADHPMR